MKSAFFAAPPFPPFPAAPLAANHLTLNHIRKVLVQKSNENFQQNTQYHILSCHGKILPLQLQQCVEVNL